MKFRKFTIFIFIGILSILSCEYSHPVKSEEGSLIDYTIWANVLKNYVNDDGGVDYEGLKANRVELDRFIAIIEETDVASLTPAEEKAFWINAYNAVTLKVVLDKYPVKSIRKINFGLVWEVGRKVAQGKYSLGHIEHKILRPMGDPRIHFAINCASIGCPKLPNKPFYPQTLDKQLDDETKRFLNDPEKVRLDRENNILYHSAILDWFEKDFLVVEKDILSYIKRYRNADDVKYIEEHSVTMKASKYDWGLNKQ